MKLPENWMMGVTNSQDFNIVYHKTGRYKKVMHVIPGYYEQKPEYFESFKNNCIKRHHSTLQAEKYLVFVYAHEFRKKLLRT